MHTVPQTILAQLGGNRFLAMTGAKHLTGGVQYLSMALPNARYMKAKITHLRITLDPSDTYTVEALHCNMRGKNPIQTIVRECDVYCDNLRKTFTQLTGLETSL
jgi:hypothetical protein